MYKIIFYILSFLISQYLFILNKTNDTISIFAKAMTNQTEQLNTKEKHFLQRQNLTFRL